MLVQGWRGRRGQQRIANGQRGGRNSSVLSPVYGPTRSVQNVSGTEGQQHKLSGTEVAYAATRG
eukprot:1855333-Rhodomonas_salina.1